MGIGPETMRVMLVADAYPPQNRAGAAASCQLLAAGLSRRGCEVLVVTHGRPTGRRADAWRIAPGPVAFPAALLRWGPRLLREFRPDVVEFQGPLGPLMLSAAKLRGGLLPPAVGVVRGLVHVEMALTRSYRVDGGLTVRPSRQELLFRWLKGPVSLCLEHLRVRWCERIVCVSHSVAERYARRFGCGEKVEVIWNGVDTSFYRPDPKAGALLRRRLGLEGVPVVAFAGVFRMVKGLDVLLSAMRLVCRRHPDCVLLVAGSGHGNERRARRLAEQLGLQDRVRFLGWLEPPELVGLYAAADVLAVPSRYEAFGLVVLQGMACGRPVVASSAGGSVEAIGGREHGRCVPPDDAQALAEALGELLGDADLRESTGRAARARACKYLGVSRVVDARMALYRRLTAGRRPGD